MLVYAAARYAYFADALVQQFGFDKGEIVSQTFPDGERYHRLATDPYDRAVVLVGGTASDADTLEVFDLAYALVTQGARSLKIVIPYFGYSTMERAVKQGEVVKARTRARLLSAIPSAALNNEIILFDLHSEGIPHYFDSGLTATHLYAKPAIIEAARRMAGDDFVLASTDAGRAKWVESLAKDMKVDSAFIYKRRESGSETRITGVNADVRGRKVVIYDDMIRTGGSLVGAARAYRDAGASAVYAIATHLILPDNALEKIRSAGVIEQIAGSDSHPNAQPLADDFLQVFSAAPIFGRYLTRDLKW